MQEARLLLDIGMILLAGLIGGGLFIRLRFPAAVGIILAGVVLNPFTPGYIVNASEDITFIGQIGAILLMFTIGLEFDYRFMRKIGIKAFTLAAAACAATFAAGSLLGMILGLPYLEGLLVGIFFVSTSTTIGLKMIDDMGLRKYKNAGVLQAALVIDDLYGFFALTIFTAELGAINEPAGNPLMTILLVLAAVIAIFIIGIKIVPKILSYAERYVEESSLTLAVAFCLFLSYAVMTLNISPLIGAFLAGTILTASISHRNVLDTLKPLMYLFGAVFFVSIGLSLDPGLIGPIAGIAILYSVVAFASKTAAAAYVLRKMGTSPKEALVLGAVTGPRGEVLLIIAQTAVLSKAVGPEYLAIATAIVFITTITTPLIINRIKVMKWYE